MMKVTLKITLHGVDPDWLSEITSYAKLAMESMNGWLKTPKPFKCVPMEFEIVEAVQE